MYVTRWAYPEDEVTDAIHGKQAAYEDELKDVGFVEEMFDRVTTLTTPTFESDESFYEEFMLLESDIRGAVRLGTAAGGNIHNIYITIKDLPDSLEDAEALARAIVSVGHEFGGSHAEVSDYTNKGELSVQMIAAT